MKTTKLIVVAALFATAFSAKVATSKRAGTIRNALSQATVKHDDVAYLDYEVPVETPVEAELCTCELDGAVGAGWGDIVG
jgi:hypothetical protein